MFMFWHIGVSSREALIYFVVWRNSLLAFTSSMLPCLVKHVINCWSTQHPSLSRSLLSPLSSRRNTSREVMEWVKARISNKKHPVVGAFLGPPGHAKWVRELTWIATKNGSWPRTCIIKLLIEAACVVFASGLHPSYRKFELLVPSLIFLT